MFRQLRREHTGRVFAGAARLMINFVSSMLYLDRTRCNPEK